MWSQTLTAPYPSVKRVSQNHLLEAGIKETREKSEREGSPVTPTDITDKHLLDPCEFKVQPDAFARANETQARGPFWFPGLDTHRGGQKEEMSPSINV